MASQSSTANPVSSDTSQEALAEAATPSFWTSHLDASCRHFIGSNAEFLRVEQALKRAVLVGLDAEWKPISTRRVVTGQKSPRVSILQIACRLGPPVPSDGVPSALDQSTDGYPSNEDETLRGTLEGEEVVFILDMLALSPEVFAGPLKAVLRSPHVIKLGYGLRDDMKHLAASHPGPEAQHCFDEVEPYIDIGRLHRRLRSSDRNTGQSERHRRQAFLLGGGLSSVIETVLGLPLCKDLQCSNWEERPLSGPQLDYAAMDALCLLAAFDKLSEEAVSATSADRPSIASASSLSPAGIATVLELVGADFLTPGPAVGQSNEVISNHTFFRPMRGQASKMALAAAASLPALGWPVSTAVRSASVVPVTDGDLLAQLDLDGVPAVASQVDNATEEDKNEPCTVHTSESQTRSNPAGDEPSSSLESQTWSNTKKLDTCGLASWQSHWRETVGAVGERLSLHEVTSGKEGRRKGRKKGSGSERTLESRQKREEEEEQQNGELEWRGPPPWDPMWGGDGVPKFLCDSMIEGLARQLRCVGLDTASPNSKKSDARQLVQQAEAEGRVLLTRDVKLLRRRLVPRHLAYRVRSLAKQEQLKEVITTFGLEISEAQLLSRCIRCNGAFVPTPLAPQEALAAAPWTQVLPPCALRNVDEFWQCSACRHLYWEGSQFDRAFRQFASVCQPNAKASSSANGEGGILASSHDSGSDQETSNTTSSRQGTNHNEGNYEETSSSGGAEGGISIANDDSEKADQQEGKQHVKGPRGKTFVCGCRRNSSARTKP